MLAALTGSLTGKLTYVQIEEKITAAATAEPLPAKAVDKLFDEVTTCFQAAEYEKAIDMCVILVAQPLADAMMESAAAHNLASAVHQVRVPPRSRVTRAP